MPKLQNTKRAVTPKKVSRVQAKVSAPVKAQTRAKAPGKSAVPVKSTTRRIEVQAIKPSDNPEVIDGETQFTMTVVQAGVQKILACSKEIYKQIKNDQLILKLRHDFMLRLEGDKVVHIGLQDKPDGMSNFKKEGDTNSQYFNLSRLEDDNVFDVDHAPSSSSSSETKALCELLAQADRLKSGTVLDGRYRIVECTNRDGRDIYKIETLGR